MPKKAEPGINYYPVKTDHINNSKIRLLFNEFNADGYWIWSCLLGKIYGDKGYYFDVSDSEELELFASDVCKRRVSQVNEVILGCVRRGLFSEAVFNMFSVITSDRIQFNYIEATSERRRKGTVITIIEELLLISPEETWKNVVIRRINDILPRKIAINPRKYPHSRKREDKIITEQTLESGCIGCADASPPSQKKNFKQWTDKEFYNEIAAHAKEYPKEMLRAFFDYWSEKSASGKMLFQLKQTWETKKRLDKWHSRENLFSKPITDKTVNGNHAPGNNGLPAHIKPLQ